jgi:hypothetical protein
MCCLTTVSFAVLINGSTSPFFHAERGLRQGCPMSPLLFLLVAEGLSRAIEEAKAHGEFQGIAITPNLRVTHLLFVDDVLIFCNGKRRDAEKLKSILELFERATRNANKWEKIHSHCS